MSLIERLEGKLPFTGTELREAKAQLEAMQAEIDRLRDFVEEVAGSCIPDYEEAKRDAQTLLGDSYPRQSGTELRQVIASALDALEDERPWCAKDTLRASLDRQGK